MTTTTIAIADVLDERVRQKEVEGWTPEHDNQRRDGELIKAAICYAANTLDPVPLHRQPAEIWPWEAESFKPKNVRRDLVRAASLLVAAIEQHDRATAREAVRT